MCKLFFTLLLGVLVMCHMVQSKKILNVGFFLQDDDQRDMSRLAILTAIRHVNMMTDYVLKAHFFNNSQTSDILRTGQTVCDLAEKGLAAIFGPESPEINEIIQSVSSTLEIPQFQTFWNPKLHSFSTHSLQSNKSIQVFNLYPVPYNLSRALATLVRENDWKSYTVIYENDDGLLRLQETLKQRNPADPAVTFRKLGEFNGSYSAVLKEIKSSGVQHFILDCEVDHILAILRQAKNNDLLSEYYSYILTNLDAYTLDWSEFRNTKANVTALRLLNITSNHMRQAVAAWNQQLEYNVLDSVKNDVIQKELGKYRQRKPYISIPLNKIRIKTALLYDALNLFITTFIEEDAKEPLKIKHLSCDEKESSSHGKRISETIIKNVFKNGLLYWPISGPTLNFNKFGQRVNFQLQVIEFHSEQSVIEFKQTGVWDSATPEVIHSMLTSEQRATAIKKRIQEKVFKVVSRVGAPYLIERHDSSGKELTGNDRFEGYAMDLMIEICKPSNLNCSFTFELVNDGHYGNLDPVTKKWNGLIKELLEQRADLAVCDLTITYERRKAVDFTMPFMTLGISILYAKAVKEPPELLSFSHPLALDIWLYMATSYLVISMIIFLVARLNPNDWENPHPCDPSPQELENIWNIRNCCWLTLGSIMAQGCDILPKGISTRMVTSMWWFFSLIMTACYTANLAAFLTMERMGPTIESADDLASQNKIKYGCLEGGSTASFFKDTNFSTYHRMWVQMESADPNVFEKNNKEGVKRVLTSKRKYAFIMESSSIEYETERNCELLQVGQNLDTKGYGIAMPTNAPYRKSINEQILKMQEMGVLLRLKDKWWKEMHGGGQCTEDKHSVEDTATELGLDHVGGVFVVLAAGVCIALVIAVCEFLWSVRKVAVVQHLTPKEAFYKEFKFAMDIWARKKEVITSTSRDRSLDQKEVKQ